MKKICILFVFSLMSILSSKTLFSQVSFNHAAGFSYYIGGGIGAPGLTYSPRINVVELNDETTISIGTHLGLGFTINANSQTGVSEFGFALDLPLMAELNFGHGSHSRSRSGFGGFGGVGFGISRLGSDLDRNNAMGPVVNAGVRFLIANDYSLGARASFLLNINEDAGNVYSGGIFYTF